MSTDDASKTDTRPMPLASRTQFPSAGFARVQRRAASWQFFALEALLLYGLASGPVAAQGQFDWDASGTTTNGVLENSANGVWDTTTTNWVLGYGANGVNQAWTNGNWATFTQKGPTTSYTVTVTGAMGVHEIDAVGNGVAFTLNGGSILTQKQDSIPRSYMVNYQPTGSFTINSVLAGTQPTGFGFYAEGTGSIVVGGNSTYTGTTELLNGTTEIGAAGTTGSIDSTSDIIVNSGATLSFNRSNAYSSTKVISGGGIVRQMGAGTTTFSAANTYTGATNVTAGTLQIGAGGTSGSIDSSSGVSIAPGTVLAFNRSDAYASTKVISGAGGVTKLGSGTSTLSAGNTYTGPTTVSAGTLSLSGNGFTSHRTATTIGSGARLSITGATDQSNATATATYALNAGGTLENANASGWTVITGGAVTNTGATTIAQSSAATSTFNRGFFLDAGLKGTGTVTINSTFAGNGVNFRNNNSTFGGTLIVNGIASTTAYAGSGIGVGGATTAFQNADITLNGTMELLNGGIGWANVGAGAFQMGALNGTGVMVGNFTGGGGTTVTLGNTNAAGTFGGVIANGVGNTVNLVKTGTGTQTLGGINIFTGTTTVNGGTLTLANPNGTLQPNNNVIVNTGATLTTAASNAHNFVYPTNVIGTGTITVNAGGTATTGNGAAITLRGQDFILNGGTLSSGVADPTHGSWILDEGSAITANNSATVSASSLNLRAVNTDITVAAAQTLSVTGTLTTSNGTGMPSGAGGGFTKLGTGTLVLSGINSHKAAVVVSAGKLLVNGVQTAATGATTVQTGATLGGTGTLGGTVTVNSGGTLSPGNSPGVITMAGLSLPAGSSLAMELGQANTVGGTYNDRVQVNGDLALGGGTLNVTVPTSPAGTFTAGTYRLIDYTGTLTGSGGLVIGNMPAGYSSTNFFIEINTTSKQVNLLVRDDPPVTGIYSTGVNDSHRALADAALETHYAIISGPTAGARAASHPGYIAKGYNHSFISDATASGSATWVFRLRFNGTAGQSVRFHAAADNYVGARMNGTTVLNTYQGFSAYSPNITTALATGVNVLDVDLIDVGAPSAVLVVFNRDIKGNVGVNDGSLGGATTATSGVTVRLFDGGGTQFATTTTDVTGNYVFAEVPIGTWYVAADAPVSGSALAEQVFARPGAGQGASAGGTTGWGALCQTAYVDQAAVVTANTAAGASGVALSCYGGRRGATADSAVTTLDSKEHVQRVVVGPYTDVTGLDFGFSHTLYTNVNASGQGTLAQAAVNAGVAGIANTLLFRPAVAAVSGRWTVSGAVLPTDAATELVVDTGVIVQTDGVLSGGAGFLKSGAGTLVANVAGTYAGTTSVSGGILQLGLNSALPSTTAATVAAGATLDVNGKTQSIASATSAGTLALGTGGSLTLTSGASSIGAVTGTGTITVATGSTLTLTSALSNTGLNIVLAGGTLNLGVLTHSIGTLSTTAASTLDFAAAVGTSQLTVATLTPTFALATTNWTSGTDHLYAAAVTGAPAKNTANISPLNNIVLTGYAAARTVWLNSTEVVPLVTPMVAKIFSPASVATGIPSTLTITLTNPNTTAMTAAAFTDTYPSGLVNTTSPAGATTCTGGTVTAAAGSGTAALSGGSIPASGSCTVTVNVTSATVGSYVNTIAVGGVTTSSGSNAVAATATLTVIVPTTFWDGAGTTSNSTVDGGTSTWNTTASNWTTSTGTPNGQWFQGGTATFAGAAGTVTVNNTPGPVNIGGLTFNTTGYVLSGGTLTGTGATTNTLTAGAGISAGIDSTLGGSNGFSKAGTGTITLTGAGNYSGNTKVDAGTLSITGGYSLPASDVSVNGGATLTVSGASASLSASRIYTGLVTAGTLTVSSGASVSATGDFMIGSAAASNGTATITGSGSKINSAPRLIVGDYGTATMMLSAGATATSTAIAGPSGIAIQAGSSGGLTITGAGSTLNAGGIFLAGHGGTAVLNLNAGGTLNASTNLVYVSRGSTVNIGDGSGTAGGLTAGGLVLGSTNTSYNVSPSATGTSTLNFKHSSTTFTFPVVVSGNGNVTHSGTGTTTLSGASTYAGTTVVSAGILQVGNGGTVGSHGTGAVSIAAGSTLEHFRSSSPDLTSVYSGAGNLNLKGTGVGNQSSYALTGANTGFTGVMNVTSARLIASTPANTGSASIALNTTGSQGSFFPIGAGTYINNITLGGTGWLEDSGRLGAIRIDTAGVILSGTLTLTADTLIRAPFNNADMGLFSGAISGAFVLSKQGTGVLTLTGSNTYGATSILDGTLQIGNGGTTGTLGAGNVANAGTLAFKRSNVYAYGGIVSGAGGIAQTGTGTTTLSGASTYAGTTVVSAGILQLGLNSALPSTTAATVAAGATLDVNGKTQSIASVTSAGTLALGTGGSLTLTSGASSIGAVTGTGTITVATGSTLTLTSAQSNTGVNIVLAGGTLNLGVLTHSIGTLSTTAASTLDFAAAVGTSQLTVATLTPTFALATTNWTSGTDHLYATAVTGAPAKNTANISPLNNIVLTGNTASRTAWLTSTEIAPLTGPTVAMTFSPDTVATTVSSKLTITLTNPNAAAMTAAAFTDTYPSGLVNTASPAGATTCTGGTVTAAAGSGTAALSGGSIPASGSCTVTVNVTSATVGSYVNTIAIGGVTTSSGSNAVAATATLTVIVPTTFWDGTGTTANSTVDGGTGTWNTTASNWTTSTGTPNGQWFQGGTATFAGAAGTVTVNNTPGPVNIGGLTFNTTGYTLSGGTLTGTATTNVITAGTGIGATIGNVLAGSTAFTKTGAGAITLSGFNTYTGSTIVDNGTLTLSSTGSITSNGTLENNGTGNLSIQGNVTAASFGSFPTGTTGTATISLGGVVNTTSGQSSRYGTTLIDGAGSQWNLGTSSFFTVGNQSPGTVIVRNQGLLKNLGSGATLLGNFGFPGSIVVTGTGSKWTNTGAQVIVSNFSGSVGSMTIADGAAFDGMGQKINVNMVTGTVNIGTAGLPAPTSFLSDELALNAAGSTLNFNHSGTAYAFGVPITGLGDVNVLAGTTVFSALNSYKGATTVSGGKLLVNGNQSTATGAIAVASGATLGGSGTLGGKVTVANGGTMAPGNSPGTLAMSGLVLNNTAILSFELGQAGTPGGALNDLIQDNGALTLDGTLDIAASAGGSFTPGVYRLVNYTGALTNNTLVVGTVPAGVVASDLRIDISIAGQVNLVYAGAGYVFWDAGAKNNGTVDGGTGTWQSSVGNTNWTLATGAGNASWYDGGVATFAGTAGTVTVDNASGAVNIGGLTFATTGYLLGGGTLNGTAATNVITSGAGMAASISSVLTGTAFDKRGTGALTLLGANSYSGTMTVSAGELAVQSNAGLGSTAGGTVVASGATLALNNGVVVAGERLTLSGTGHAGRGALRPSTGVASGNSWSGPVTLAADALISNALGLFSLSGTVDNAGYVLTLDNTASAITEFTGAISGAGGLVKLGSGTLVVGAAATYGGATTVSGGTLKAGVDNALPSTSAIAVASASILDVNDRTQAVRSLTSSGTVSLGTAAGGRLTLTNGASSIGAVTGTGTITVATGSTLTLTSALSNTGVDIVLAGGTLNLGAFTHSIGKLTVSAASTLDFSSAGNAQLATTSLTVLTGNTLAVTNWTQGGDRFYAAAFVGAARNTIGAAPMNRITLGAGAASTTVWKSDNEITLQLDPKVRLSKTSNGGVGSFVFQLTGLSAANDSIATVTNGIAVQGLGTLRGTQGVAVSIVESGVPAGWPANPLSASCVDANGANNANGAAAFGTLAGNTLSITANHMLQGADIACSFVNTLNAISGTVFNDGGAPAAGVNTGIPNDGLQNGSETGLAGVVMRLTDCASTTHATATTDSTGRYALSAPVAAVGQNVCVLPTLVAAQRPTGANVESTVTPDGSTVIVGGTSFVYTRATSRQSFIEPASGTRVLNFGLVPESTLAANSGKTAAAGATALHGHTFVAGSGGSVSFASGVPTATPPMAGWSEVMYLNPECAAGLPPGATKLSPPSVAQSVVQGQTVCFFVQAFVPAGAVNGSSNSVPVIATMTFTSASPLLTASYTVTDVTTAGNSALSLQKEVRNITTGGPWGTSNQAKSGNTLEYRITYSNPSAAPLSTVVITDGTNLYTTFVSAVASTAPPALGSCMLNTPGNPAPAPGVSCTPLHTGSGKGTVRWEFSGTLAPGATGTVSYSVVVD